MDKRNNNVRDDLDIIDVKIVIGKFNDNFFEDDILNGVNNVDSGYIKSSCMDDDDNIELNSVCNEYYIFILFEIVFQDKEDMLVIYMQ